MARKPPRKPQDYAVGYGKPPEHSRFRRGQSGNPKGRPKGSANLRTLLEDELAERIPVKEGGRRRQISKAAAVIKQLVNKAAAADLRAIKILLGLALLQRADEPVGESTRPGDQGRPRAGRPDPQIDYASMTTAELATLYEAATILEGRKERPPAPVPPSGPEEEEE
jgi:hypothetical protein